MHIPWDWELPQLVVYLVHIIVRRRNSHDNESHMFVESANYAFLLFTSICLVHIVLNLPTSQCQHSLYEESHKISNCGLIFESSEK